MNEELYAHEVGEGVYRVNTSKGMLTVKDESGDHGLRVGVYLYRKKPGVTMTVSSQEASILYPPLLRQDLWGELFAAYVRVLNAASISGKDVSGERAALRDHLISDEPELIDLLISIVERASPPPQ